jgi:Cu/Ag efflux protein CusF
MKQHVRLGIKSWTLGVLFMVAIVFTVALAPASAQNGKKEYAFRGTVEKVDTQGNKLTVNNEKVEGWMASMTMTYKVDKPEVLKGVKAGDQITAKVYEGNFETLYNVQRVPPKGK